MCGIVGIFDLRGSDLPPFDPQRVLQTLHHRGPDDTGIFQARGVFMGSTRLAIIDPANGRQPASDEAGRYHVVMNGEIFSFSISKVAHNACRSPVTPLTSASDPLAGALPFEPGGAA